MVITQFDDGALKELAAKGQTLVSLAFVSPEGKVGGVDFVLRREELELTPEALAERFLVPAMLAMRG